MECSVRRDLFTTPPPCPSPSPLPSPPRAPRRRGVRRAVRVDHVYARRRVELHVERRLLLLGALNHEFLPKPMFLPARTSLSKSMSLALHTISSSIDAKI